LSRNGDYSRQRTPFLKSTIALTKRWFRRMRREPADIAASVVQPAVWLILFGSAFNKIITFPGYSYIAFMTSGVVVMTTFNGALYGGVEILFDRESKIIYRLISSPIVPSSIIISRVFFVLAITTVQSLIVLAVASTVSVNISSGALGSYFDSALRLNARRRNTFYLDVSRLWFKRPRFIFLFTWLRKLTYHIRQLSLCAYLINASMASVNIQVESFDVRNRWCKDSYSARF
jgi:hypothetical protein